jgi:hypothetical protein
MTNKPWMPISEADVMTEAERKRSLEWCEAAIRYHEAEATRHRDLVAAFNRLHSQLCYGPVRRSRKRARSL